MIAQVRYKAKLSATLFLVPRDFRGPPVQSNLSGFYLLHVQILKTMFVLPKKCGCSKLWVQKSSHVSSLFYVIKCVPASPLLSLYMHMENNSHELCKLELCWWGGKMGRHLVGWSNPRTVRDWDGQHRGQKAAVLASGLIIRGSSAVRKSSNSHVFSSSSYRTWESNDALLETMIARRRCSCPTSERGWISQQPHISPVVCRPTGWSFHACAALWLWGRHLLCCNISQSRTPLEFLHSRTTNVCPPPQIKSPSVCSVCFVCLWDRRGGCILKPPRVLLPELVSLSTKSLHICHFKDLDLL